MSPSRSPAADWISGRYNPCVCCRTDGSGRPKLCQVSDKAESADRGALLAHSVAAPARQPRRLTLSAVSATKGEVWSPLPPHLRISVIIVSGGPANSSPHLTSYSRSSAPGVRQRTRPSAGLVGPLSALDRRASIVAMVGTFYDTVAPICRGHSCCRRG